MQRIHLHEWVGAHTLMQIYTRGANAAALNGNGNKFICTHATFVPKSKLLFLLPQIPVKWLRSASSGVLFLRPPKPSAFGEVGRRIDLDRKQSGESQPPRDPIMLFDTPNFFNFPKGLFCNVLEFTLLCYQKISRYIYYRCSCFVVPFHFYWMHATLGRWFLTVLVCSCCSEQSIASARASVMIYEDSIKRWVPSGSSSGLSKVHIYHHQVNNSFRVVGRKLQDLEVISECLL